MSLLTVKANKVEGMKYILSLAGQTTKIVQIFGFSNFWISLYFNEANGVRNVCELTINLLSFLYR